MPQHETSAWPTLPTLTVPTRAAIPPFDSSNDAPTIYLDIAPAYGVMSRIVQIELGARHQLSFVNAPLPIDEWRSVYLRVSNIACGQARRVLHSCSVQLSSLSLTSCETI